LSIVRKEEREMTDKELTMNGVHSLQWLVMLREDSELLLAVQLDPKSDTSTF
jgi:hypothetical protein